MRLRDVCVNRVRRERENNSRDAERPGANGGNAPGAEDRFPESVDVSGPRRALSRDELWMKKTILGLLAGGPRTVPEVAAALGLPPHEVMWWMMGYVRYGYVSPTGEVIGDGYHRYMLTGERK